MSSPGFQQYLWKKNYSLNVDVSLNNKVINRVNLVKFLGVTINSTLYLSEHVKLIKNKLLKELEYDIKQGNL